MGEVVELFAQNHEWTLEDTIRKPYWAGGEIKSTTYSCKRCGIYVVKTSIPSWRVALFIGFVAFCAISVVLIGLHIGNRFVR